MTRLSDTVARRLAVGVFALCAAMIVCAALLELANVRSDADARGGNQGVVVDAAFALVFFSFPTVGVLITHRDARNVIGWLMLGIGVAWCWVVFAGPYVLHAVRADPGSLPNPELVNASAAYAWIPAAGVMGVYLLLLFPDGRPPTPRWRWLAWISGVVLTVGMLGLLLTSGPINDGSVPGLGNPFGVDSLTPYAGAMAWVLTLLPACIVASAAALVVRFRRSQGLERLQLKWLATAGVFVAALTAVLLVVSFRPRGEEQPGWSLLLQGMTTVSLLLIPLAVGVAILRYRLYDIDVVISRSFVFGALAGFISVVYVAIVVGIGSLVGRGDEPNLALSVVATAVIAVAFQPVRRWARRVANRLVYGERATPYEVLAEFGERMGGAYDATELLPVMARTVGEGIGAASVELWLASEIGLVREAAWPAAAGPARSDLATLSGDRVEPVRHRRELLGALAITMPAGEAVTPAAGKLLADVAAQAGLVLRNVHLIEELRSSRRRLVTAQDDERRHLERNLHDGAQQSLVAVALMLRLARGELGAAGEGPVGAELDEAADQLGLAIEELRELARGIYPAILAERGLAPALAALAERSSVPVFVDCPAAQRLPADVERTLYFVAAEAVTNAVAHAAPKEVGVTVRSNRKSVTLDVVDDGTGGADPSRGTGLLGLAERAAVLDGTLKVVSPVGGGTRVHCVVPLSAASATADEAGPARVAMGAGA